MDAKLGSILLALCITLVVKVLNWAWFRPKKLEKLLREQGINGNPYRFILGDMMEFIKVMKSEQPKKINLSDDIIPHILPYYHQTIHKFGKSSFVWFGAAPRLNISDPELIKEILMRPGEFHKPPKDPIGSNILGGLLYHEDAMWTKHRKIINPAFHLDKLKAMIPAMFLSCSTMIAKWEALVCDSSQEVDVWPYVVNLSGDVIARTSFGSNYQEGRTIFELQGEQVKLVLQTMKMSFIPGWRFLPTKSNNKLKANSKAIQSLIRGMIKQRQKLMEKGETIGNDLLGILMESNYKEIQEHNGNKYRGMSIEDVIEECKLFYFAGSETTSNLLAWTMVLLSIHQDWQTRAREEVSRVFGKKPPTFDDLNKLKTTTMILHEVLRLYPPAPYIIRAPTKTVKLGDLTLPAGAEVTLLIGLLHHDPKIWGDDVKEFNPQRFYEGVSGASYAKCSYIPFSAGPRVCIGQNFAMIEAKMAMAMILQRFSFELSSSYTHAPFPIITLQPQHGVPLVLHKL